MTLLILALYALLAVAGTYPLITRVFDAVPRSGDTWLNYWNLWWVQEALLERHTNPFFMPDVHFPYGASLYFHTLNFLPAVIVMPIAAVLGITVAFNFLVFLSFVLSGYGTYCLVLYVLRRLDPEWGTDSTALHVSAFVAGSVFAFSSYRYVHLLGHLDLLSTQWLPLFVLFLLRARDEGDRRNIVIAAIFLAAAMLTAAYYMVFLLVFAGLLIVDAIIRNGRGALQPVFRIALVIVVFAVLVSPILVPMLILGRTEGRTLNPAFDVDRFSTDLTAFLVPSPLHPLWKSFVEPTYRRITRSGGNVEIVAFVGFIPLALTIFGVTRFPAVGKLWLPFAIVFSLLALGPAIHLAGRVILPSFSVLTPYSLLSGLPYGDIPRVPARYSVMTMLCLSVIAGAGSWVLLKKRSLSVQIAVAALLSVLCVAENAVVPLPLMSPIEPVFFRQIRNDPERKGLLEVPIPDDPAVYPQRMLYQTIHEKPIYGGYLSRGLPPLTFSAVPGFAQFQALSDTIEDVVVYQATDVRAISRAVLNVYAVGHVVIDKNLMTRAQVERAREIADRLLGAEARSYEDNEFLAYRVPSAAPAIPVAVWLDRGWFYLERLAEDRWHWMSDSSRLGVLSSGVARAHLKFAAQAFGRVRRLQFRANDAEIATIEISTDRKEFDTPVFTVRPETRFVELRSLDGADSPGQDARRLSVAIFKLELVVE